MNVITVEVLNYGVLVEAVNEGINYLLDYIGNLDF